MLGLKTIKLAWIEFKYWRKLYNATKESYIEEELKEAGFKVSWLGYPYKIIKIPNEFMETEATVNNYMFEQLREIDSTVTTPLNISELCFPNFIDIAPATYLVKLESKFNYLRPKTLIPILLFWGFIIWVMTRLTIKYDLFDYVIQAFEFINNILF